MSILNFCKLEAAIFELLEKNGENLGKNHNRLHKLAEFPLVTNFIVNDQCQNLRN